ncbi:hypothetical protein F2P81_018097 [Scophthalmus maximus]|nr:hypothetical protein F2P81_018097 [Scophthalmus maximus]
MSVNSSSSCDALYIPTYLSSSSDTMYCQLHTCLTSTLGASSIIVFSAINTLLLLPLSILVLCLGCRQRQRSGAAMSHSDVFTYHLAIMELVNVLASFLSCCGIHVNMPEIVMPGVFLFFINLAGQMWFHILTCVERYLAAVHPITYLGLRAANGIRIRNITIGCVWLLSCGWTYFLYLSPISYAIFSLVTLGFIMIIDSFCCLSVVCVLIGPGPSDRPGGGRHVDRTKLRALHTIGAIMGVLVLRFGGNILISTLYPTALIGNEYDKCSLILCLYWICLPSSLVIPLLFLHRAGKFPRCKTNVALKYPRKMRVT